MKTKELVAFVAIITLLSSSVCLILQDDSYADPSTGADEVDTSKPYYIVTVNGISITNQVPYVEINSSTQEKAYCLENRTENGGNGELHDEYVSRQGGVMFSYYRIFDDDQYKGADIQFVIPEGTTLCLVNEFTTRDVRVEFGAEIGSISIVGGGTLDANPTSSKRDEVGFNGVPTTITGITLLPTNNSVVYGGSVTKDTESTMNAVDLKSTDLTLENVTFNGTTYAGSLAGDVGTSSLTMIDMNITVKRSAYGGNAVAGHVDSTNVVFDGGNIDNIYGGGASGTSCGTTNVNVLGGSASTVYGGGSNSPTSHTFVHIGNDAEVRNDVFGGGYNRDSVITEVTVDGGSILGSVYGGCHTGDVTEDAYITISGGEIGQGVLAGGNYGTDITNVANAHIAITGGTIGYGEPSVGDTEADMTRGVFAAGGNAKNHGTVTNIELMITGGTIYDITGSEAYNPDHPDNVGKGEYVAAPSSFSIRVSGGSFTNDISDVITDGYVIQNADGSYSVSNQPPFIPGWDDDDEYIPPIVPAQPSDSGDDNTVTVVACAAAAVVAALMAAFLILDRKR